MKNLLFIFLSFIFLYNCTKLNYNYIRCGPDDPRGKCVTNISNDILLNNSILIIGYECYYKIPYISNILININSSHNIDSYLMNKNRYEFFKKYNIFPTKSLLLGKNITKINKIYKENKYIQYIYFFINNTRFRPTKIRYNIIFEKSFDPKILLLIILPSIIALLIILAIFYISYYLYVQPNRKNKYKSMN